MPSKPNEQKKEKPPQIPPQHAKDSKLGGFDISAYIKLGANWKYTAGIGLAGAAILFFFYILKLVLDSLLSRQLAAITLLVYPIALFTPILIGIGIGFGLKRLEGEAKFADGAIAGAIAGILGSALGAILILTELLLLKVPAPYFLFGGNLLLNIILLLIFSTIQALLCIISSGATARFLKGG